MAMDTATKARYEAWKRKKIMKLGAVGASVTLLLVVGLVWAFNRGPSEDANYNETGNSEPSGEAQVQVQPGDAQAPEGADAGADTTEIRVQFAGDVFLHAGPIEVARTGENTFDFKPFLTHIAPYIDGDLVLANMETPVDALGGNQGVAGFPLFNAPFEILEALDYAGFNHLISANNHSFDMGFDGLINTVYSFERAGITQTGMNVDWDAYHTPTLIDVDGIVVGVLAYAEHFNGEEWRVPEASRAYAVRQFNPNHLGDVPRITADMDALREAGAEVVIVALHWGQEYGDEPLQTQRDFAHALTAAGADVIMGKHSHTVHPMEWHEREDGSRALIIYSLGNFVADQTRLFPNATTPYSVLDTGWNAGANTSFAGRTQFGKLVTLEITREADGEIVLGAAMVLPTLCMRDFSGETLGTVDGVTVLPLFDGELPAFVTDESLRHWGREAYAHVTGVVGAEFVGGARGD